MCSVLSSSKLLLAYRLLGRTHLGAVIRADALSTFRGCVRRSTCGRPSSAMNAWRFYSSNPKDSEKQVDKANEKQEEPDEKKSPTGLQFRLTDLHPVCWGRLTALLRKSIESYFFRKWFDPSWNEKEFLRGAVEAVRTVSDAISRGDFAAITDVIDKETIDEIRENYQRMTDSERRFIRVKPEDFIFCVIYRLGFAQEEANKRYIEVQVLIHGFEGASDRLRQLENDSMVERAMLGDEASKTRADEYYILNYCFRKRIFLPAEQQQGKVDPSAEQWTISALNHFKLDEYKKVYMWRR